MKKKSLVLFTVVLILAIVMTGCGRIAGGDSPEGTAASSPDQATLSGESTPSADAPADADGAAATGDLSGAADTGTAGQMAGEETGDGANVGSEAGVAENRHIYRTVRVIAYVDAMMPPLTGVIENIFGFGDRLPTLTLQYDTTTGAVEKATFSTYYSASGMGTDEYVAADIEALSQDNEMCARFSDIRTQVIEAEDMLELSFDIDMSTYFNQLDPTINLYLVGKQQDLEGYMNAVYYDRLDNYDEDPPCEVGDNFFYETINFRRIEWED